MEPYAHSSLKIHMPNTLHNTVSPLAVHGKIRHSSWTPGARLLAVSLTVSL